MNLARSLAESQRHIVSAWIGTADAVGIFPKEAAAVQLIGAVLLEQSDKWAAQRSRYMTLETIGAISNTPHVSRSAVTA